MTTFNTVEELLEILDNSPQILSAVRSKILTDELIKMPHEFAEFRESTEKFRENTEKFQERMENFQKRTENFQEGMEAFRERTENSITEINTRLDTQQANFYRLHSALDRFRGAYAMEGTRRYRRDIARTIARGRGNRLLESVVLDDADLNLISVAAQDMDISDTFGDFPESALFSDLTRLTRY